MTYSHSRVDCFNSCPYRYRLKYLDCMEGEESLEADNPLILGTAMHMGLEKSLKEAVEWYYSQYPIATDAHVTEAMKLESVVPKAARIIPNGDNEVEIRGDDFLGYADLIAPSRGGVYIYDFKYTPRIEKYLESAQLHLYKFFYEKQTGKKVNRLFFLHVPKTMIRQKKTETLEQFRQRLNQTLKVMVPELVPVKYDESKVFEFFETIKKIENEKAFEKKPGRLCDWCEYKKFCEGGTEMQLPKNERARNAQSGLKKIWLYGLPFSGKTYLANTFPDVLMLNTDGNIKYVDAPYIAIRDNVSVEGHITKRVFAWDVFKDTIAELEKKQNEFKTIVVDLLEDTYEHCRLWCYDHLGIEHESDNSFKAWDFVRTEFLSTIKRLMNLDYNIVLISHEDTSRDITKKTGDKITAIKPNLSDKIALKIAGMVDIVGRVVNDEGNRIVSFKTNEVIFGGGRLPLTCESVPCTYGAIDGIYTGKAETKPESKAETPAENEKGYPADWDEIKAEPELEPAAVTVTTEADAERYEKEKPRRTRRVRN